MSTFADLCIADQLGTAVALADAAIWELRYENERFATWFPAEPGVESTLLRRVPGFEPEHVAQRLARGRPARLEITVRVGPRSTPLMIDFRPEIVDGVDMVVVEAQNITRQKEAEYMLDSYSRMMERQARDLEQEKERVERLLLNVMPRSVAAELRDFGTTTPRSFGSASVLMLDFVDFTEMAVSRDPSALVAELNDVFTSFDRIMEHSRCERIKTIGDGYLAVAGVPEPDPDHERNIARAALRMRKFLRRRNTSAQHRWDCRIGIGHGPVIGSIVGVQKYVYDIFGPAVNYAARLETLCEPMQILISAELAELIGDEFIVRSLGPMEVKGFGTSEVFALEDEARKGH